MHVHLILGMKEYVNNMKRFIVPIILLVLVIIGLASGIYFTSQKKNNITNAPLTPTPTQILTLSPMELSFQPNTIKLTSSNTNKIEADIVLDVSQQPIENAIIVITCDPKRVKNLTLTQKRDRYSALSYAFAGSTATINQTNCEAKLNLITPKETPEQRGSGVVARITADVLGNGPTEIIFNTNSSGTTRAPGKGFEVNRINLELTK